MFSEWIMERYCPVWRHCNVYNAPCGRNNSVKIWQNFYWIVTSIGIIFNCIPHKRKTWCRIKANKAEHTVEMNSINHILTVSVKHSHKIFISLVFTGGGIGAFVPVRISETTDEWIFHISRAAQPSGATVGWEFTLKECQRWTLVQLLLAFRSQQWSSCCKKPFMCIYNTNKANKTASKNVQVNLVKAWWSMS